MAKRSRVGLAAAKAAPPDDRWGGSAIDAEDKTMPLQKLKYRVEESLL
jgi:hypothetical protein